MTRLSIFSLSGFLVLVGLVAFMQYSAPPDIEISTAIEAQISEKQSPDKQRVLQFWTHYREATNLRLSGQQEKAINEYEAALNLNPHHEDALYYLANVYINQRQFQEASSMLSRLIEVDSNSARAYTQLGVLHTCRSYQAGFDLQTARDAFQRAHDINKEQTGPLIQLGQVALLMQDWPAAGNYFDTVLGSNHQSIEPYFLNGFAAWKQGDLGKAVQMLGLSATQSKPAISIPHFSEEGDTKVGEALVSESSPCALFDAHLSNLHELPQPVSIDQMTQEYRALDHTISAIRNGGN